METDDNSATKALDADADSNGQPDAANKHPSDEDTNVAISGQESQNDASTVNSTTTVEQHDATSSQNKGVKRRVSGEDSEEDNPTTNKENSTLKRPRVEELAKTSAMSPNSPNLPEQAEKPLNTEQVEKSNSARTETSSSKLPTDSLSAKSPAVDSLKPKSGLMGILNLSKNLPNGPDQSNSKGGDSDKENVDTPMDLSTVNKTTSNDIIMLSDDDDINAKLVKLVNGFTEMTPEEVEEKRIVVRKLQGELRNEEAKLVLLKKLRQSQLIHDVPDSVHTNTNKVVPPRQPHSVPPPLVRGGQSVTHVKPSPTHQPLHLSRPQIAHSIRTHGQGQGPPPLVMAPRHSTPTSSNLQQQHQHQQQQQQQQQQQPPQHVMRSGSSMLSQRVSQGNVLAGYRNGSQHSVQQVSQQANSGHPEQTPAQRQAAAKLALRKQLEKTLLQIPPPKPPPPEMNFIPSLAGNEFIMLAGLEEVVKYIVDTDARAKGEKAPEVKYVFNPFICVQCGTDFTPVWKRDKPGSKNVICEQCVTSNQKKALKQEHTNRLKSAFVKALQQEQEIEQRMQVQTTTAPSSSTTNTSHSAPSSHSATTSHQAPVNLSSAVYKPTTELLRQHQNMIQAHQAQLRGVPALSMPTFNPRMAFPFQPPMTNKQAADLQRQYLLDMIPRNLPGQRVLWRT